jgi:putative peptide zinc metalloprotease protein
VSYAKSDLIDVIAFTRQKDGEEVVIGRPDTNVFLSLPEEAVEILDNLSNGKTVGEAQAEFARAHSIEPDIDGLLQALEQRGFIRPRGKNAPEVNLPARANRQAGKPVRYHFTQIPVATARRFFGPVPMTIYLATIAAALVIAAMHPSLIPRPGDLKFTEHRTAKIVTLSLIVYGTIFLHEFAHLLAARAQGVKSRIGISNRLWVLVAETDMTGLWAVPSGQRYLPVLAGPLLDAFSASVLFILLYLQSWGVLALAPNLSQLFRALIFIYLFRLLWQCFLFVRTDFYFVLTTFFGCKNLMKDTQVFIYNLFRRAIGSKNLTDQSYLPPRERRVVRLYSVLWVAGRGLAFFSLFFITLPILFHYIGTAALAVQRGYGGDPYQFFDSLVVGTLNLAPLATGLFLWITSLVRRGSLEQ